MDLWSPLDDEQTIFTATYAAAVGPVRSVLLPLRDGAALVYSPGAGLSASAAPLLSAAERIFLLAPSAGHTGGLAEWLAQYPAAEALSAEASRARIARVAGRPVGALEDLAAWLPEDATVHQPPVSVLGETWLRIERPGRVYWVVCDAFVNARALTGSLAARWLKRLYRAGPGLEMTRLFVWNIKDKAAFRQWVASRIAGGGGDVLVPCHGEIDRSADVGERLLALVEARCR